MEWFLTKCFWTFNGTGPGTGAQYDTTASLHGLSERLPTVPWQRYCSVLHYTRDKTVRRTGRVRLQSLVQKSPICWYKLQPSLVARLMLLPISSTISTTSGSSTSDLDRPLNAQESFPTVHRSPLLSSEQQSSFRQRFDRPTSLLETTAINDRGNTCTESKSRCAFSLCLALLLTVQ
eukprot:1518815-Rhodomonas_salina.2